MSKRNITFSNHEYYHVYNRGNSKQLIFLDQDDKFRFIQLLNVMNQKLRKNFSDVSKESIFVRNDEPLVAIGAYVLMDNHFHILLKQMDDDGISKFIQKLCTAYAGYFNKKYKRTGGLYEGKFKAKHANEDNYLKYLYSYIHLNPAKMIEKNWKSELLIIKNKEKYISFLKQYKFSSFQDYAGEERSENNIITKEEFPTYFRNKKEFLKNILSWLSLE